MHAMIDPNHEPRDWGSYEDGWAKVAAGMARAKTPPTKLSAMKDGVRTLAKAITLGSVRRRDFVDRFLEQAGNVGMRKEFDEERILLHIEDALKKGPLPKKRMTRETNGLKRDGDPEASGLDDYGTARAEETPAAPAIIRPPRFKPISLDDIVVGDEPTHLIEGLLPAGPAFGIMAGAPKTLKTFVYTSMGLHVAANRPYGGRAVMHGAAGLITSEGILGVQRRLVAMRRHMGVEGKKVPFFLIPAMPNLGTGTDDLKELCAAITEHMHGMGVPLRMLGIDTLRRATAGKDEISAKDMGQYIDNCDALSRTYECLTLTLHHSPRSDEGRGSGTNALDGAADVILSTIRNDVGGVGGATVSVSRMKDGEEGDTWSVALKPLEVGINRLGAPIMSCAVEITSEPRRPTQEEQEQQQQKKKKTKRLSDRSELVKRSLANLLCDHDGSSEKPSFSVPGNAKAAKRDALRERCWRDDFCAGLAGSARKRAFDRAIEELQRANVIGVQDGWLWLAKAGPATKVTR
jgi:putative DNA primase/helicase